MTMPIILALYSVLRVRIMTYDQTVIGAFSVPSPSIVKLGKLFNYFSTSVLILPSLGPSYFSILPRQ